MFKRYHNLFLEFLSFCFLLIGILFYCRIVYQTDIDLWDESGYLFSGINNQLTSWDWGPIYSLWYKFLSFFQSDTISLYYLSAYLVLSSLFIFLYIYLRRINFSSGNAIVVVILLMINPTIILTIRRPNQFAFLVLLFFLILITFLSKKIIRELVMLLALFLVTLVRPEFILGFIGLGGIIAYQFFRKKKWKWSVMLSISICILLVIIFSKMTGKSFNVFVAKNAERLGRSDNQQVWRELYGNATSILGALVTNSCEFVKHIIFNFKEFILSIFRMTVTYLSLRKSVFICFCFGIISTNLVYLWVNKKKSFLKLDKRDLIYWVVILITIMMSSVIYGVLFQYMIVPYGAFLISVIYFSKIQISSYAGILIVICLLLFPPKIGQQSLLPFGYGLHHILEQNNLRTVYELKKFKKDLRIISSSGDIWLYISPRSTGIGLMGILGNENKNIFSTIENEKYDVIEITQTVKKNIQYNQQLHDEITKFMEDPGTFNYTKIESPADRSLYKKK